MTVVFDPRAVTDRALRSDVEQRIDALFYRFSNQLGLPTYTMGGPPTGNVVTDTMKMRGFTNNGAAVMVGPETPQRLKALRAATLKALADLQNDNASTFVITAKDAGDLQRLQGMASDAMSSLGVS